MKKCKYCQSEIDKKAKVCPHCRKKQPQSFTYSLLVSLIFIFILIVYAISIYVNGYTDFENYKELNPQELHDSFLSNEISAKNNYENKFYYFKGEIFDITEFLNDTYLSIRYKYDKDNTKIIELDAYFNDKKELETLKKGEQVTVYCQFKKRAIENYLGSINTYSFKNCKFKK